MIGDSGVMRGSRIDFLTITIVTPDAPMFFWAPQKIKSYSWAGTARDRIFEDMSHTINAPGLDCLIE